MRESSSFEPDALAIAEEEVARQEELARVYRVSERLLRERNLYTFGAQLLAGGGIVARGRGVARANARSIPLHPGGRISGHEYRAARIALAAGGRPAQYSGGRRRRSGDLPFPRRIVRQLHDFSRAILRRGRQRCLPRLRRRLSFRSRRTTARRDESCAWPAR